MMCGALYTPFITNFEHGLSRRCLAGRACVGFTAERFKSIAQGFSPGLGVQRIRPESGGRGCDLIEIAY
jgi:hypothetical protein